MCLLRRTCTKLNVLVELGCHRHLLCYRVVCQGVDTHCASCMCCCLLQAAQERQKALNQVTNVLQQKIRALQLSQPSSSGGVS
jgi:hypothetical protein